MAQIWVGMHSIKESLRLLESNPAEEDWDTRYWTWVDREILAEAAALAEGTEQDVEPVALDSADPAVDADVQPGLGSGPALAAEAALDSGPALVADSDRALAALATQLTVPALAAEMTVPAAAVEAAPDPDHGLPVDRGPDEAGDAVPAPVLASVEGGSSGSKEEIQGKLDDYADNVTVAENSELWKESYVPGHALEKFSLDEIPVPKVKAHVAGKATKPP